MKMINILFSILLLILNCSKQDDKYMDDRMKMVSEQIEGRGITNQHTLDAMKNVPRHKFVPPNIIEKAYNDSPLPIGYGQTISQPYIVAFMTAAINPKPGQKVLEIGTGSGYQAAILSEIVDEVYTIEIVTELFNSSSKRLSELGYKNVKCKNADGYYGWKEHAPFDAIIVTAASEYIPPPLIEQLKDGGRMIIPIGSAFLNQMLVLVEKSTVGGEEEIFTTNLLPVRFVPFTRGN